jgi:hypothetical protein
MRKFEGYPIYINHPGRWEEVRQRQLRDFRAKGDSHMTSWLKHSAKQLYEIMEDQFPRLETREWEQQVYRLLMLIGSTRVGKLLFESLNPTVKHWIIPLDDLNKATATGAAYAFPGHPKEGGGVRVYFNPPDFNWSHKRYRKGDVEFQWRSADDVLFHEMVHAYRLGRVGYYGQNWTPMNEYETAEEFLALHLQNIYLESRGSQRVYRDYRSLRAVSKDTAYQYFVGDAEVLMAFRHYLDREPLAKAVAQWKQPADSFNPWRDLPVLERLHLSGLGEGNRLPELGSRDVNGKPN